MLPPIMLRGESDSRLNLESCEGSPQVLNRSNSEGCLLQMEKEKEKKDKEKRQVRWENTELIWGEPKVSLDLFIYAQRASAISLAFIS